MKILQTLALLFISVLILMTLWPLFIFLVIVSVIVWIVIRSRLEQAAQDIQSMNQNNDSTSNVIDVEITNEREE